jgi:thiamine pyrophosphate-dependent acetolactate synthase large subunit-like protein
MSSPSQIPESQPRLGAHAVVEALVGCGIKCGFGVPSIHNVAIYEALRQTTAFQHWMVRHEQAGGFAADALYRRSGNIAAVFASTGPGNLFTVVPLLESWNSNIPLLLIGTNIHSLLQARSGGALHETPNQLEIFRPLTRYVRRLTSPEEIPLAISEAAEMLLGSLPGPAFIEIPHDLLTAPVSAPPATPQLLQKPAYSEPDLLKTAALMRLSRRPAILIGGFRHGASAVCRLAEQLQAPVFTSTAGKGQVADDHPLSMGCISRLGPVQEVFEQCDLLMSFNLRLTEFDTGQFRLVLPKQHIRIVSDPGYAGTRFPAEFELAGDSEVIASALARQGGRRQPWFDVAQFRAAERTRLESLNSDAYRALMLIREALRRDDVVSNDQSILNYWASAFFPVFEAGTFLYPDGSGTLGYGLPAAIGAACAIERSGGNQKVICIVGDGGFQYTMHELATLAQYRLPVKVLLVNDNAYGVIAFLQRIQFGHTHEVALQNPNFCRLAEAYGIPAWQVKTLSELEGSLSRWLETPGPALMEWQTALKSPWEAGAIPRPSRAITKQ